MTGDGKYTAFVTNGDDIKIYDGSSVKTIVNNNALIPCVALDPENQYVYYLANGYWLNRIGYDGTFPSIIGNSPISMSWMTFMPNGNLLYISYSFALYVSQIDPISGTVSQIFYMPGEYATTGFYDEQSMKLYLFSSDAIYLGYYNYQTGATETPENISAVSLTANMLTGYESECDQDCNNYGDCVENTCECYENYYGATCSIYCSDDIACNGHGTCMNNGSCDCYLNWAGNNCATNSMLPPTLVTEYTAEMAINDEGLSTVYTSFLQDKEVTTNSTLTVYNDYSRNYQYLYDDNNHCSKNFYYGNISANWIIPSNANLLLIDQNCDGNKCYHWSSGDVFWSVFQISNNWVPHQINYGEVDTYATDGWTFGTPAGGVFTLPAYCPHVIPKPRV